VRALLTEMPGDAIQMHVLKFIT